MKKTPKSSEINTTVPALFMLAVSGLITGTTITNLTDGNPIQRGLATEIAATDAALTEDTVDCMASHAARTVQNGSMLRPGPMPEPQALRANAIASARTACAS
jgi:hypothetical protein